MQENLFPRSFKSGPIWSHCRRLRFEDNHHPAAAADAAASSTVVAFSRIRAPKNQKFVSTQKSTTVRCVRSRGYARHCCVGPTFKRHNADNYLCVRPTFERHNTVNYICVRSRDYARYFCVKPTFKRHNAAKKCSP